VFWWTIEEMGFKILSNKISYLILLHSLAPYNFDLGVIIPPAATAIYIEVPLLEGTFFCFPLHVSA
jgi:hypothetical protein